MLVLSDMLPDKFLRSFDGVRVAYRFVRGVSGKPVLVFVHGLGGNSSAWDGVVDVVQKNGFSALVLDLRGHGLSEKRWSRKFYSVNCFVKDIGLILEKEGIEGAVVVGHSFGGSALLKYLLSSDNRVGKVVLCNSAHTVPFYYNPYLFVRVFYPVFRPLLWLVAALSFVRKKNFDYPIYSEFAGLSEFDLALKDLSGVPLRVYCWNFLLLFDYRIDLDDLKSRDVGALLITSDKDGFLSSKSLVELSKIMKGSKLVMINDCDHETIIRKPEVVANHILGFLK